MPYFAGDNMVDAALEYLRSNCDLMTYCAGYPTSYAEATDAPSGGGRRLVNHAMSSGDFSIADGATGGRSLTVAAQDDTVDENGTGDHVAFLKTGSSEIIYVAPASEQPLTAGQTFQFPTLEINLGDPEELT